MTKLAASATIVQTAMSVPMEKRCSISPQNALRPDDDEGDHDQEDRETVPLWKQEPGESRQHAEAGSSHNGAEQDVSHAAEDDRYDANEQHLEADGRFQPRIIGHEHTCKARER